MKKINIKEINKPYVVVNKKLGILEVIYRNRIESYKLNKVYTKSEMDKEASKDNVSFEYEDIYGKGWNKEHEFNLAKGSGFHQIGLKTEIEEED